MKSGLSSFDVNRQRNKIQEISEIIKNTVYDDRLSVIKRHLKFVRSFGSRGVQGIVGTVELCDSSTPVVFKTSVDINRTVEHEYKILEYLNNIREYCPHFVRSLGMIELPISREFIEECYKFSLFYNGETLPRSIMFMECVNKFPFYKLCQATTDKNIITSQICQILIALETAQRKCSFTHYDLHTSNILIQHCEPNSVFLYRIGGKYFCIPTYGFFPIIIDTGISYCKCIEGDVIMTNTDNYDRGFQSTVYDGLNDIHHFLLTTFYYIEPDSDAYDSLSNKIKFIFRHLPVLKKSGWKVLPKEISEIAIDKIKRDCKYYRKYDLFYEYNRPSIEVLNGLISLPIKNRENESFTECFTNMMTQFHKMIDIDDFSEADVMFVLRTLVDCVNSVRKNNTGDYIDKFKRDIYDKISIVLHNNVNYKDVNYEILLESMILFGYTLETVYYKNIYENNKIISEAYKKTVIKCPTDMVQYIGKNLTPHMNIDNDTIVYVWDVDKETNSKRSCKSMTREQLSKINNGVNNTFVNRGKALWDLLEM